MKFIVPPYYVRHLWHSQIAHREADHFVTSHLLTVCLSAKRRNVQGRLSQATMMSNPMHPFATQIQNQVVESRGKVQRRKSHESQY